MSLDKPEVESSNPNLTAPGTCGGEHGGNWAPATKRFECRRCRGAVVLRFPDSLPTFEYSPTRGESPLCVDSTILLAPRACTQSHEVRPNPSAAICKRACKRTSVCDVRGSASQVCECLCQCCARSRTSELACLCLTRRKQLQFVDESTGAVVNITGHTLTVVGFKTHHGFEVFHSAAACIASVCAQRSVRRRRAGDHIRRQRQARHVP